MILTIIIVIISLMALLVIHEFGHFIAAKKLGVRVDEFGIGYPPRLFGKKFKGTIYSVNLLPFGAFVRIAGEEKREDGQNSFSQKPVWQRMIIILGGVISFWLIAFLIFSIIAGVWGLPMAISDSDNFQGKSFVQIIQVGKNSPAETAGLKAGDIIKKIEAIEINKISEVQEITQENLGKEIDLNINRGKEVVNISLIPRENPPQSEGPIGIALARVGKLKSKWYESPLLGAKATIEKTIQIPTLFIDIFKKLFNGEKVEGVQMTGVIGLGSMMNQALQVGVDNFLMFIAIIAVWLALFNILPIPALDGGKMLFLIIEAIRRKPIQEKTEIGITNFFFILLLIVMAFVTVKDILNLF